MAATMEKARPAAVVYAAKSSPDERDSVESQVAHIQQRLASLGQGALGQPFTEERVSGFKRSRGAKLEKAIRAAVAAADKHGEAELWVFHSSRLARGSGKKGEARALAGLYWDLRTKGVAIRSVTDDEFVTNSMLIGMASEQNHKYSADLSEHVQRGKRGQWDRGERLGGPIVDGYVRRVVRDASDRITERHYLLCPERAPILSRLFSLAESGMADANIARRLNSEGYRTRGGIAWTRRRVQDTVTNPFYAGRVARGRWTPGATVEWKEAEHPALVDPGTFDRIQGMRAGRDRAKGSNRKPGRPYSRHALAGLASCGRCGESMRPLISPYRRKDGTQRRTYQCSHVKECTGLCDQPSIDAEAVDRAIVAHLRGFFIDFDGWTQAVLARSDSERHSIERNVAAERKTLAEAERRAVKLAGEFTRWTDEGDETMARAAATSLEAETRNAEQATHRLSRLEGALKALPDEAPTDALLDHFNRLSAAVRGRLDATGSLAEVNEELRTLFDRFELDTTSDGILCIPVLAEGIAGVLQWNEDTPDAAQIQYPGVEPEPIPTLITGDENGPEANGRIPGSPGISALRETRAAPQSGSAPAAATAPPPALSSRSSRPGTRR